MAKARADEQGRTASGEDQPPVGVADWQRSKYAGGRNSSASELPRFTSVLRPLVDAVAGMPASVHTKLLAGFLVSTLLLVAMAILSALVINRMSGQVQELARLQDKVNLSRQMEHLVTAQSHYRAMALLTGDESNNAMIAAAKQEFLGHLDAIERLGTPHEGALFRRVREANSRFAAASDRVLGLHRVGNIDEARRLHLAEEHAISHELEAAMRALQRDADQEMAAARAAFEADRALLTTTVVVCSAISLPLALLLGFVFSWSFVRPVRRIDAVLAKIAAGQFGQQVDVPNRDEFGTLSTNLNSMSTQLATLYSTLRLLNEDLQAKNEHLGLELAERRRIEAELAVARDQALDASRAKSSFLANMSHELRTPLNAIIGYSEMLHEEAEDQGQADLGADLRKIHTAGKHLLTLINDVLDLSKIEAGKTDLYLETFSITNMVGDVAAIVQPLVDKNANVLQVHCPEDLGAMRADMTKVRQALFNLLSNACKFTHHGTISLTVARETVDGAEWVTFAVTDSGIGISAEQMGTLFQAFSQASASTAHEYEGTGLGLAISRRFCQMMGGDITVESAVGQGSTFTIRLPAEVINPKTAPPPLAETAADGAPIVLVIDDDPATRDLLQRFLSAEGFGTVTAAGGEEGLRLARDVRPQAITLDVLMPGMDGWAVLAALKADAELADIPVILLTILDDKNLGYALGASDYLTKPVDRDRLVATLRQYACGPSPGTVLVIEDDDATRQLLQRTLQRDGWTVSEAENGRVGLERVAQTRPEVILLDLMMPEMDGLAFIAELHKQHAWRAIPIVVITAKDLTDDERVQLKGSVEAILHKGASSRQELLAEVRDLVAACVRRRQGATP